MLIWVYPRAPGWKGLEGTNTSSLLNYSCIKFNVGRRCPLPSFTLRWGRTDTTDCSDAVLPSPTMTGDEMFTYFETYFGFSRDQVPMS